MSNRRLDRRAKRALVVDWFVRLAKDRGIEFPTHSTGADQVTLGDPDPFQVVIDFMDQAPFAQFTSSDSHQQRLVDAVSEEAFARADAEDLGGVVWYSTLLIEGPMQYPAGSVMSHLLSRLGSQTRIVGWRRLGNSVLLEFAEEAEASGERLFVPKATVHVHIAAPGPGPGEFSSRLAHGVIEVVGAICGFALGRAVSLPTMMFPTNDENVDVLESRRSDPEVLTLARKGISLDVFTQVAEEGGLDVFQRGRAALVTYDAAVQQERDSVATILFTVAAESLTVPPTSWRTEKLTKRFISFFDELIPFDLDRIVAHDNFEQAFSISRGARGRRPLRRELLNRIYDDRSGQLHQGLTSAYQPSISSFSDLSYSIRRGLVGDFAEAAILGYLSAPRSSLVGHPSFS